MRFAVYLPWLVSLLVALPATAATLRTLPDHADPRPVLAALTASMATLSVASTMSLGLLVVAGARDLDLPGALTSPDGHTDPGAVPVGVVAALGLAAALGRTVHAVWSRSRRCRRVQGAVPTGDGSPAEGTAVLVEDDHVFAVATPPRRRHRGRVVLSRGMWAALKEEERAAVVAHEQEHLDRGHHRHLAIGALAIALNPLLAPWWHNLVYCAERCADEGAARRVTDRRVLARAVGRAALAARSDTAPPTVRHRELTDPTLSLGVSAGSVPRRVSALLTRCDRARRPGPPPAPALVAAVVLLTVVALAAAGAAHAAWDLSDLLGTALTA